MKKALAISSLVVVLAAALAAQANGSRSQQNTQVPSVTIPFVADDSHGRPITGFSSSALSLLDDKHQVQGIVTLRGAKEMPLRLGLLIDTSSSQGSSRLYAPGVKAAFGFLNQMLRSPDDKGFIMPFDAAPHGTGFMSGGELMQAKLNLRPGGAGAIYDALNLACSERMRSESSGVFRRVLVLLTDGDDNYSHVTRSDAIGAAQRAGTVIFTVSTGTYREGDKVLDTIASETGGIAFSGLNDLEMPKVFAKIKTIIEQMYSVTYVPPQSSTAGQFRAVELTITSDKKARVHAPKGYYAASAQ